MQQRYHLKQRKGSQKNKEKEKKSVKNIGDRTMHIWLFSSIRVSFPNHYRDVVQLFLDLCVFF